MSNLPSIFSQLAPVTKLLSQDRGDSVVRSSVTHLPSGEDIFIGVRSPKRARKSESLSLLDYLTKSVGMSQKSASFYAAVSDGYASKLLHNKKKKH